MTQLAESASDRKYAKLTAISPPMKDHKEVDLSGVTVRVSRWPDHRMDQAIVLSDLSESRSAPDWARAVPSQFFKVTDNSPSSGRRARYKRGPPDAGRRCGR